jgi:hypothetical protein
VDHHDERPLAERRIVNLDVTLRDRVSVRHAIEYIRRLAGESRAQQQAGGERHGGSADRQVVTPLGRDVTLTAPRRSSKMRLLKTALLVSLAVTAPVAQTTDPLLSDKRLTVHTLVREDVFAGFRNDNLGRLAKAEQNIEILLKERPEERANLLAWRAGAATYRAVRAHEAGQAAEF